MGKKRARRQVSASAAVTPKRAARLYRLVTLLAKGPRQRTALVRQLRVGLRGFYRDLDALRRAGIEVSLLQGRYGLAEKLAAVTDRLLFPDPALTLGEARQLARGRTAAHRKLAAQIAAIIGPGRSGRA